MSDEAGDEANAADKAPGSYPVTRVIRNRFGPPDQQEVCLRYVEGAIALDSTLGATISYYFRANSIYDPNQSGTGHQPLWRDTYAGMYNHYAVKQSKIIVHFISATEAWGRVGVGLADDSSGASGEAAWEQTRMYSTAIGGFNGGHDVVRCECDWNSVEVLGVDSVLDSGVKTTVGATPTEETLYQVVWQSYRANATDTVRVTVEIHYDVIFSELATQTTN